MELLEFKYPDYGESINRSFDSFKILVSKCSSLAFATGYAILSIIVVLTGNKGFDKVENVLAIIKTAAIVMFIIIAAAAVFGWLHGDVKHAGFPNSAENCFQKGGKVFGLL